MRKITGRGESAGLLEPEQANGFSRSQMYAETADIPDPVLEETGYADPANAETGEPFLRARQRVPVRRRGGSKFGSRFAWKSRWVRAAAVLIAVTALGLVALAAWEVKSLVLHNPRFFLPSTANIQVTGNRVVTHSQVLALFVPDTGRTIFRVPLAKRQAELEQIRWVRRATVMRLWPNHLGVSVLERTPVAFARAGNNIQLVDDEGVLLDFPDAAAQHYSFPVLNGISSSDPLSTRAARIGTYRQFVQALDADGGHVSATLSEVDLSDPEDVRAMFADGTHQPLIHFGASDFLARYHAYRAHLAEWLQQYPQLRSVDMRYGRQVVLDTGSGEAAPETPPVVTDTAAPIASKAREADAHPKASVSKPIAVKSKTRKEPVTRAAAVKHRATTRKHVHNKHVPSSAPERGHPVRHPIMHVVTGT